MKKKSVMIDTLKEAIDREVSIGIPHKDDPNRTFMLYGILMQIDDKGIELIDPKGKYHYIAFNQIITASIR